MPNFYFTAWSPADLGYAGFGDVFNASTIATIPTPTDPTDVLVNDDDNLYQDGSPDNGQAVDQGTPQTLVNDLFIDGSQVGSAGDTTYIAYTMTFTNLTTGQVGSIYVMTVGGFANGNIVGFVTDVDLNPGDQVQTGGPSAAGVEASSPYEDLICFAADTQIETAKGRICVQDLCPGDMVKTLDHGLQEIRWIGHRRLSPTELDQNPKLAPITICPSADILSDLDAPITVSPQHRFAISSPLASLYFDNATVLVAAHSFWGRTGVSKTDTPQGVNYYHIMFDAHEIIFANGTPTESFHFNKKTAHHVDSAQMRELMTLFPHQTSPGQPVSQTVRPCIKAYEAAVLLST